MKKIKLLTIMAILLAFSCSVYSQQIYVKAGVGYGFSLAEQKIYDAGISSTNFDIQYGSFNEGTSVHAGFGYNINKNFAVELDGSYMFGGKYEYNIIQSGTNANILNKWYANTISIIPSLVLKVPSEKVSPYSRLGVVFGIPTKYYEATTSLKSGTYKLKETGGLGIGFQGAFGINYNSGNNIDLFAEVYGTAMSWSPSTLENTENFSGVPLEPTITYESTFTKVAGDNKAEKPKYPFSNFGINIGFTYNFGR